MSTSTAEQLAYEVAPAPTLFTFSLNQWFVAALSRELQDKPIDRTLLNKPVVLFRTGNGQVAAPEDRCCHRALPPSNDAASGAKLAVSSGLGQVTKQLFIAGLLMPVVGIRRR